MSDEVLIRCENVGKKFCRDLKKSLWYGVQDSAADLFCRSNNALTTTVRNSQLSTVNLDLTNGKLPDHAAPELRTGEFWATRDVRFELKRGECLGLIGRNGSGKTTLLKMLNGLIKPDQGRIEIRGRVGALIALGAGFNGVLTGRENIAINAAVLGLTKQKIKSCIDEIIEFADLEEFIDTPVKNYSSGMQVRLGFSIATVLNPDLLILDEVLAVGDAAFRNKCYHRIRRVMHSAAVIFVSHSMDHIVQTCSSVVLMRRGIAELYPDVSQGVAAYNRENTLSIQSADDEVEHFRSVYPPVTAADVKLRNVVIPYAGSLSVEVAIECQEDIVDVVLVFSAVNVSGQMVMAWHTGRSREVRTLRAGRNRIQFSVNPLLLHEGIYRWHFNLVRRGIIEHLVWFNNGGSFSVTSDFRPVGEIPYLPEIGSVEISGPI